MTPVPSENAVRISYPHRKTIRWALVAAGTLIAASATAIGLIALRFAAIERADAQLAEEALDQARSEGAPLTVEAIAATYATNPEIEATTKRWEKATGKLNYDAFVFRAAGVPIAGEERDDGESNPPNRDACGLLTGDDLRLAREFANSYREAIDAAHSAAREGEGSARYDVRLEEHVMAKCEDASAIRALGLLLRLDAESQLARGDVDAACDDLLTTIAAGESLSGEPLLVSQLIRISCVESAKRQAAALFANAELDDERLERIQRAFYRPEFENAHRRALQGDRYFFVAAMRGTERVSDEKLTAIRRLRFRGRDLAKGLELFRRAMHASEKGLLASRSEMDTIEEEVVRISKEPSGYQRYAGTIEMVPAFPAAVDAFLSGQASATVGMTAAACERYRVAHGSLPETLDRLVPEYLDAVPIDSYRDAPLSYVVDDEGAAIYSIGQDGIDDLGALDRATSASTRGDVVVRLRKLKFQTPVSEAP